MAATVPENENITELRPGLKVFENSDEIRAEWCTHASAAAYVAEKFGPIIRYSPGLGWPLWDGRVWRVDDTTKITECVESAAAFYRHKATEYENPKTAQHFFSFARQLKNRDGVAGVMDRLKHRVAVPASEFDRSPWLVNCNNVTLDFSRMDGDLPAFHDHLSCDNLTRLIPTDWNIGAAAPKWAAFLERILPNEAVRDYVQRAVGYSLLGSTREQVFFVCYGEGANGKSTLLNVLHKVIGEYAQHADSKTFMAQRNDAARYDLADLRGVRFLTVIETGDGRRLDEGLIKQVTGGDPIRACHKYEHPFQFDPEFTLWLATNAKPTIGDTGYAIWRRVRLIPFEEQIPENEWDRGLKEKIVAEEAEGVLAWAIRGTVRYMHEGLTAPDEVKAATENYRRDEDRVGKFVSECCVEGDNCTVGATEIFNEYKAYIGERASRRHLSDGLVTRGYERVKRNNGWFYIGIGLLK